MAVLQKLMLASKSPRRAEILRAVGWPFEAVTAGIDETIRTGEDAITYVKRLALEKASAVPKKFPHGLVLGADTVVVVDDQILGQPLNQADARRMITLLSGRWHEVVTGVALVQAANGRSTVDHESTAVRFSEMSKAEIEWYVSTDEPFDKAGAYAIQGMGGLFIEEIRGDYFNIVGLPIRLVYELSQKIVAS